MFPMIMFPFLSKRSKKKTQQALFIPDILLEIPKGIFFRNSFKKLQRIPPGILTRSLSKNLSDIFIRDCFRDSSSRDFVRNSTRFIPVPEISQSIDGLLQKFTQEFHQKFVQEFLYKLFWIFIQKYLLGCLYF